MTATRAPLAPSGACCSYCGLPLADESACAVPVPAANATPSSPANPDIAPTEPRFCCYGCRFAASVTHASGDVGQARGLMTRLGLALFFTMNVMVFTMFLWSRDESQTEAGVVIFHQVARYICLLFSSPVLLLLGEPLLEDAIAELRRGRPSASGLLALGVGAAFVYSLVSVFRGEGHVYFEVSCMVLVAVTLGRYLEANGKLKTTAALRALQQLLPDTVRVIRDGQELMVPRQDVQLGESVRVVAGERIPVDGQVIRNRAAVDQQAVTGESVPVVKEVGDTVFSGTLNVDGDLWIETSSRAGEGTLQRIITAVEQAAATQNRYQRLATRISAWFLPTVSVIAVLTFIGHWYASDLGQALLAALAVVVIACPCALGLATPMALWAALGAAARRQVLLRDGDCLIRLASARVFCFDKTGTLTTGQSEVGQFWAASDEERPAIVPIAAALAGASTHPLSQAVVRFAAREGVVPARAFDTRTLPGRGLVGTVCAETEDRPAEAFLGSSRLMTERELFAPAERDQWSAWSHDLADAPRTLVAWRGRVRGGFVFDEQLRPSALPTLETLVNQGRDVVILTGDAQGRAATLAERLGVQVRAELLPEDKLAAINDYVARGIGVAMVGDGINDAPALAAADVGVALGCGTDVSRYTAGVCLLGDDLSVLPWLVDLAERTVKTVRWNLFWAFAYNTAGIAIAAMGWLNPILAALAMTISSLLVVSNSLALGRTGADAAAVPIENPGPGDRGEERR